MELLQYFFVGVVGLGLLALLGQMACLIWMMFDMFLGEKNNA